MKISILNKWDIGGGAARAAYRLANVLYQQGHDLKYIVNIKEAEHNWIHQISKFSALEFEEGEIQSKYIDRYRTASSNTYFSYSKADIESNALELILDADIINLHWIEKFISTNTLSRIAASGKPIIWTLHDERPFTGGCHYTSGCYQFALNDCKNCIQLSKDPDKLPYGVLMEKKQALQDANLAIVSPSKWLAKQALESALFKNNRVEVIPNSLEIDIFKPIDKKLAKQKLGLPLDEFIILFGAQSTKEKRKGYLELCQAMKFFHKDVESYLYKDIHFLTFGENTDEKLDVPIPLKKLGTVTNDSDLVDIYSAADIFVIPSKEDNLPNTILEAMACGTPVVAFDIGGVGDLVETNKTGFLVPVYSARALSLAVYKAYMDPDLLRTMSINCSDMIRMEYTQEHQASRYMNLFNEMMRR